MIYIDILADDVPVYNNIFTHLKCIFNEPGSPSNALSEPSTCLLLVYNF